MASVFASEGTHRFDLDYPDIRTHIIRGIGATNLSPQIRRSAVARARTAHRVECLKTPDWERCVLRAISTSAGAARRGDGETRLDPALFGAAAFTGETVHTAKLGYSHKGWAGK